MSERSEILRIGVQQCVPRQAKLLVVVENNQFLRNGPLETSVYDPGVLRLEYRPARAFLDWTALNLYLDSFRTWNGSSEAVVATIAADLKSTLAPGYLLVELVLPDGKGGYRYSISATHGVR